MPEIPDHQTLMLPVLRVGADGEIRVKDCVDRLAREFQLTDAQRGELLPSGRQTKFANRVHWARTYLIQAGLLEATRRGHFRATERGHDVLRQKPSRIDNDFLDQFPSFREFRLGRNRESEGSTSPSAADTAAQETVTPEERIESAYEEISQEVRQELLDRIVQSSPAFFERVVVDLMMAMGYGGSIPQAGKTLGRSGDGGIDGVINEDALGLDSIYIQAKRYTPGNAVGIEKVREFAGSLAERGASKGVFVTTSGFVASAWSYAERIPQTVVLIDGERLTRLLVAYGVGVRVTRRIELKRVDLDYFEEADGAEGP